MPRILVTGATGFLGGAVARELWSQGHDVLATGRNAALGAALESEGIAFQPCDLSVDPAEVERLVKECEVVIHAAALSSPWGPRANFVAANVLATRHVVRACERTGVRRLVHISSPSVLFAFREQGALKENAAWSSAPANDYIATKREAEGIVADAGRRGLDAIILRPKALFGPGDTTLLPRVIHLARRGRFPLIGAGDPLLDLTWIGDAAGAVVAAQRAPAQAGSRVYHITSGDPQPRSAVLRTVLDACGFKVPFHQVPLGRALAVATLLEFLSRAFTQRRWEPPLTRYSVGALAYSQTLDISAARADLHYAPKTDVLAALQACGESWRAAHEPGGTSR
jgi:nucleoside-diphosphate-sugar epimerase